MRCLRGRHDNKNILHPNDPRLINATLQDPVVEA